MNPNIITSIIHPKFVCEICNFKCSKKGDHNRHIATDKHKLLTNTNTLASKNITFNCDCGKVYKHMPTLCAHKKKCIYKKEKEKEKEKEKDDDDDNYYEGINIKDKDALVLHLLKQNGDLQKSLIEMTCKSNITNNNTNSNSHNTTNNAFNLNFFLNETCKDAMNISDFVSSIKMSLDDLENTGRQGYIEGISSIIINNLNKLGQIDRPLHCGDNKREILYIKDNNEWVKESDDKPILTRAIKSIANQNIKQIKTWRDKHANCTDSESNKNNLYLKIVSNSMNGLTKEEGDKNISKIISNVAKKTIIQKD
jgi:hypothetical protein